MEFEEGRKRVIIENVQPEIGLGHFPIKRVIGEKIIVEADIFGDGHDALSCLLLYRHERVADWAEVPLKPTVNDRWQGEFKVSELGHYRYTVTGWVDHFKTWRRDLEKKIEAGQDVTIDLQIGARLVKEASERAAGSDAEKLRDYASALTEPGVYAVEQRALDPELAHLVAHYPDRRLGCFYGKELLVVVDRVRARFGSWYELFPRSCASQPGQHGTLSDCEQRLSYVASMGFDVLYLPPIHPIGQTFRKGKNNTPATSPEDPGSPWAIGSKEGGHKSVHPQLGALEDFQRLVSKANEYGLEVAMDLAYQCTPDHPYVKAHPEWFRQRPDGSIPYAENPPKKYQDIYPLDFESPNWKELWEELRSVVVFWIDQGVRIFRVDNPHTKPFPFWEWMIKDIKAKYPDVIFLAEAFTRPKVMYRLAKLGFTQSYSYFAWRNTKWELTEYFTELTRSEVRQFFRPNLWPNTPDILTEYLQIGGRPAFMTRLALAATLGASYGIYGPAFELCENRPLIRGKEEYLDSEKYEIRHWDLSRPDSLKDLIARINAIRRGNPALHSNDSLSFLAVDNEQLIAYATARPCEGGTGKAAAKVVCSGHRGHSA
jgi:starch synthase (maltosyl-transferring)